MRVGIVDWNDAAAGSSIYDFSRSMLLMGVGKPQELGLFKQLVLRALQNRLVRHYETEYRARVGIDEAQLVRWTWIAAVLRLSEGVEWERATLRRLVKRRP